MIEQLPREVAQLVTKFAKEKAMLNSATHQSHLALGRVKHTVPQPQKSWVSAAIEGLKSGRAAQHAYSHLRARGVPTQEAGRLVVDKYFGHKA